MVDLERLRELAGRLQKRGGNPDSRDSTYPHTLAAHLDREAATTILSLISELEAMRGALEKIKDLSKPGQKINIEQASDIICDIWNEARVALARGEG